MTKQQKELEKMVKSYSKKHTPEEVQQMLLDQALSWIASSAEDEDSLTEKVVNISVVWHDIGVTWLNKDGSYHSKVFRANKDPKTKDYAPTEIGCFNNMHRI